MNDCKLNFNAAAAWLMEPEELATKLLFVIKKFCEKNGNYELSHDKFQIQSRNLLMDINNQDPPIVMHRYYQAFSEAWSWMEVQGLIVPKRAEQGRKNENLRQLSRRASAFSEESDVSNYALARKMPKDSLHPAMADKVWSAFIRGEYDVAVLQAMKAVEVEVREASGLVGKDGIQLISAAFAPQREGSNEIGPLTDPNVSHGEQKGRLQLFMGAYSSYRNSTAHRDISIEHPAEAIEIVTLANHLLRIVDARRIAQQH